MGIYSGI